MVFVVIMLNGLKMKLIIFDLDGVLVKTDHIHDTCFKQAISSINPIAANDPLINAMDGLRTIDKLKLLNEKYNIDIQYVDKLKEKLTIEALQNIKFDQVIYDCLTYCKSNGYQIALASNSRRAYVDIILKSLQLNDLIQYSIAGDELDKPKPHPECFNRVMAQFNIESSNTIIFEDSIAGKTAGKLSGAFVIEVDPMILITMDQIQTSR